MGNKLYAGGKMVYDDDPAPAEPAPLVPPPRRRPGQKSWGARDAIEAAREELAALIEEGAVDGDDDHLPDEMAHYTPVAIFTTEEVRHSTTQWGDLNVAMKVGRAQKYRALPATDYPGCRLFVVVYAPDDVALPADE